jgi:UPF0755 protein
MKRLIIILGILLLAAALISTVIFFKKIKEPYKGYPGKSVKVEINKGMNIYTIINVLKDNRIIDNKLLFRLYLKIFFPDVIFKAGEYQFSKPLTLRELVMKLKLGDVVLYKITLREGLTIRQTAELFARLRGIDIDRFIAACKNTALIANPGEKILDLEGYLFPDTYFIPKGISAKELVKMLVDKFNSHITNKMRWQARELGLSIAEIVTLASLIEKETSSREERFLISSVFHNRLKRGIPLGCDPTIIYALMRENKYRGKLGWDELKVDSPYNTRIHRGLPPGPICSPGYASLEGALFPKNTNYLYFVAKDNKSHYFSSSLKEHNKAVRKYILKK